jgi:hypothetical protein
MEDDLRDSIDTGDVARSRVGERDSSAGPRKRDLTRMHVPGEHKTEDTVA